MAHARTLSSVRRHNHVYLRSCLVIVATCLLPLFAHAAVPVTPSTQPAEPPWPVVISAIEVTGLTRTELPTVLRELPFAAGEPVDEVTWDFAIKRLWNLGIFADVDGAVEKRGGRWVAVLTVEERWTLIPLLAFGVGAGTGWFRAGATDANLAGKFLEAGAQYQRFGDFNGFQAWAREPRLMQKRMDWLVIADRLVRPRGDFADQRLRIATEFAWTTWRDRLRLGGRLALQQTHFLTMDGQSLQGTQPDAVARIHELSVRVGRADAVRLRQTGATVELRGSVIAADLVPGPGARDFAQLWLEANAFQMIGKRWNLAGRVQAAVQGDAPKQLRFHLGGLTEVRGYLDNHVRASRYALANLETRFVALDSRWIALMPAVFVDGGVAMDEARGVVPLLSTGGGVRILFPWMSDSGLRVDVAIPLHDGCGGAATLCPTLSIGVYQFFDGKLKAMAR